MLSRIFRTLAAFTPIAILCLAARDPSPSEYQIIPAAPAEELTPASPAPIPGQQSDWLRAHGDNASSGYSALCQITKQNVKRLKLAWTYHSGDAKPSLNNPGVECNPVVVDGVMY